MVTVHRTKMLSLALLSIVSLSGCVSLWKNKEVAQSEIEDQTVMIPAENVLLTIDGKPVLTVEEYEQQLQEVAAQSPQLEMMLQMSPNVEYDLIFNQLKMAKLMNHWAHATGLTQSEEFKKDRARIQEMIDTQLCVQYYDKAHPIVVTDEDIKAFYGAEKDKLPGLLVAPGGVKTEAVKFDNQDAAQAFYDVVKNVQGDLDAAAKDQKLSVSNFVINETTFHGKALKDFVMQLTSFPALNMIKSDDAYWVVKAVEKIAPKYQDFEKVKEGLRNYVQQQRKDENMKAAAAKFEADYATVENKEYFENKLRARQDAMQQMQQQIQQQIQAEAAGQLVQDQNNGIPTQSTQVV